MQYHPHSSHNNDIDIHSVNVTQENPWAEMGKMVTGLVILIVGCIISVNVLVDLSITFVPQRLERYFATSFNEEVNTANTNIFMTQRVQPILKQLVEQLPDNERDLDYQIRVINNGDDTINAGSYPGGHMVMYQALIEHASNDDELAFVLGHELGHYHHRHHLKGLGKGVILSVLAATFLGNNVSIPIGDKVAGAVLLNFSREDEYDADDFAYSLTQQAGYDPEKGLLFFEKMTSAQLDWFSTHPASDNRIQRLRDKHPLASFK